MPTAPSIPVPLGNEVDPIVADRIRGRTSLGVMVPARQAYSQSARSATGVHPGAEEFSEKCVIHMHTFWKSPRANIKLVLRGDRDEMK